MRQYLLDTPTLSALLYRRPAAVALIDPWLEQHSAATSMLVYGEVVEYLKGRPNFAQRHANLLTLLAEVYPYLPSYPIMERYADIRRLLRPPYGPGLIGDVDTIIAATALVHDLTVVTTEADFERVPNLKLLLLDRRTLQPLPRAGGTR